ncbi:MAG: exosome complex RNA-binding protein Rrp4 [Halobacteriota archaeon]|nr:exosome complex RNA-binding protein Rrp4 [Halobacteriota archaeon]
MIEKKIAVPGDLLSDDPNVSGEGTYVEDGKVYAMKYGVVMDVRDKLKILPLGGKYVPSRNDIVVGVIMDITYSNWIVDINSPYEALLHVSEHPERIGFGELGKYLRIGDLIIARVKDVDPAMKVELTLDGVNLGVLRNGRVIEIVHSKIPRLIGRSGSMINMVKKECQCSIFVGQNGKIWVNGDEDKMALALKTITKIEKEAHTSGLTDRIAEFIKEGRGE